MAGEADPVAVVARILEVYAGDVGAIFGDPEQLAAARATTDLLIHPDVVTVMPDNLAVGLESGGEMQGIERLTSAWVEWTDVFTSLEQRHLTIELLPDGRVWAVTESTVALSTGECMTFEGASVWQVTAGRVTWVAIAPTLADARRFAGIDE